MNKKRLMTLGLLVIIGVSGVYLKSNDKIENFEQAYFEMMENHNNINNASVYYSEGDMESKAITMINKDLNEQRTIFEEIR